MHFVAQQFDFSGEYQFIPKEKFKIYQMAQSAPLDSTIIFLICASILYGLRRGNPLGVETRGECPEIPEPLVLNSGLPHAECRM
jgi:hypothetical protein